MSTPRSAYKCKFDRRAVSLCPFVDRKRLSFLLYAPYTFLENALKTVVPLHFFSREADNRAMKKYYVKCPPDRVEYFEIIGDTTDSYLVRITRVMDGDQKILDERISHDLFEICLKTGYIYQAGDVSGKGVLTKVA
jgi:hypothetical protein